METLIGYVTHYYNQIGVAVIALMDELEVGDAIHFLGHTTEFSQQVWSMEINHQKVKRVDAGEEVALKVDEPVRRGDEVFKVTS